MFDWYPHYEYPLACTQLVCFMLGMGATLSVHDFIRILKDPKILIYGLAFQTLFVPLLAVLINHVGRLDPGIAIGLVLISLMPGGSASKVFTHLGRGNVALSIVLSAFSTIAAVVTVPLLLRVLAHEYVPEDFPMPVDRILADVLLYLLSPLLVGMGFARVAPAARKPFSRICVGIGWLFVIMMVVGSLGSGRIKLWAYGWQAPAAIIVFCLANQQLSMVPFYIFRWPRRDRVAVGIEVTMRNMNLALFLFARLFPKESDANPQLAAGVLFAILYFAGTAMSFGIPLALNHLRMSRHD